MEELTESERGFVALALLGLSNRAGQPVFADVERIAHKLGCTNELLSLCGDWIQYAKNNP